MMGCAVLRIASLFKSVVSVCLSDSLFCHLCYFGTFLAIFNSFCPLLVAHSNSILDVVSHVSCLSPVYLCHTFYLFIFPLVWPYTLTNDSFEFLMTSIGFHMVAQASISFHGLLIASNVFHWTQLYA